MEKRRVESASSREREKREKRLRASAADLDHVYQVVDTSSPFEKRLPINDLSEDCRSAPQI